MFEYNNNEMGYYMYKDSDNDDYSTSLATFTWKLINDNCISLLGEACAHLRSRHSSITLLIINISYIWDF